MNRTKKKNPHHRTQLPSDPLRAYRMGASDGYTDGLSVATMLIVWTLIDNQFITDDQLVEFQGRFNKTLDMVNEGFITMSDIKRTLKKEYDWEIDMR